MTTNGSDTTAAAFGHEPQSLTHNAGRPVVNLHNMHYAKFKGIKKRPFLRRLDLNTRHLSGSRA